MSALDKPPAAPSPPAADDFYGRPLIKNIFCCVDRRCRDEMIFPNVASVRLYRKSNGTSPPFSEAIYDDLVLYECRIGYSLRDIHEKFLCDDTGRWTGSPHCIGNLVYRNTMVLKLEYQSE